jgi:hypothetical protein
VLSGSARVNRIPGANCSSVGASQLAGQVVSIEGGTMCSVSITGNPTISSASAPGWLILNDGTISFGLPPLSRA